MTNNRLAEPLSTKLSPAEIDIGLRQFLLSVKLYPQPIQQSGVEYLPIDIPRQRRV